MEEAAIFIFRPASSGQRGAPAGDTAQRPALCHAPRFRFRPEEPLQPLLPVRKVVMLSVHPSDPFRKALLGRPGSPATGQARESGYLSGLAASPGLTCWRHLLEAEVSCCTSLC